MQILNSLHVLTRFYLQPSQLSREQGREETKAQTKLERGGGEGTTSSLLYTVGLLEVEEGVLTWSVLPAEP